MEKSTRKLNWRAATVTEARWETPSARTLVLDIPDWPGHLPGQHLDIRLTAEDGYQAQRSYSIASAWAVTAPVLEATVPAAGSDSPSSGSGLSAPTGSGVPPASRTGVPPTSGTGVPQASGSGVLTSAAGRVEISVQRLGDGEVSPYLTDVVEAGDQIEVRGPIGRWFVWRRSSAAPVVLVAGGSGVVPLMAMIRARGLAGGRQPFRLIYSVRTPEDALYADELRRRAVSDPGLDVRFVYTREVPEGWPSPPKRIDVATLNSFGWPPDFEPDCFVCGPNTFVETAADILVALGHDPKRIRTERFGGA